MGQTSGATATEQATITHDGVEYTNAYECENETHAQLLTMHNGVLYIQAQPEDFDSFIPDAEVERQPSISDGLWTLTKKAKLKGGMSLHITTPLLKAVES